MTNSTKHTAGGAVPMKSRKPVETDEELAKLAQTSPDAQGENTPPILLQLATFDVSVPQWTRAAQHFW